ncbi:lipoic acid synthetase [Geoalkalibacter ferrihydriticus]|nr:lipoyl synthase [Geoalkalibacter ferrihydriticus]SDM57937.1 lipoic acid synthetase [Geoalkalibacter ferrihydriticus]
MSFPQRQKPDWLKVRLPQGPGWARIDRYHREQGLHTVCRSAACPNQGECWSRGTATFMILGNLCTRTCTFCNVQEGRPVVLDHTEPARVAQAIHELGLRHAVVTSVTRDDLPDGGAAQFARLVHEVRARAPGCRLELLIPDLAGNLHALDVILAAAPDVLGHNVETVPRLYPQTRQGADYQRSLDLLAAAHRRAPQVLTKSGLMLGVGESFEEIFAVLADLRRVGCSLLTLGQYLAPTRHHHPVIRYLRPDEFQQLRQDALALGFVHVEAGPLVRSSYHAEQQFEEAADACKLPKPA